MNMRIDNFDTTNIINAAFEQDQLELKKYSDQAKRAGNSVFINHPQRENVRDALQTLDLKQLLRVLANTKEALSGEGEKVELSRQTIPQLMEPEVKDAKPEKTIGSSAQFIGLLARISQLTSETNIQSQIANLATYEARMEGASTAYSDLAKNMESEATQWATDYDDLAQKKAESEKLENKVKQTESTYIKAQDDLNNLLKKSEGMDPIPSDLQKQIDTAKDSLSTSEKEYKHACSLYNSHTKNILTPAENKELASRTQLQNTVNQAEKMQSSYSLQQQNIIEAQRKQADEESKSISFLIAIISQMIAKSSNDELKASSELRLKLSAAAAQDSEKKAKEYEDNVRKSEEMQKTMGCIGKALGWIITAVSFAAAAFTGGASLALATIGLALTLGDEINQAITGESFMAKAMQPLMESILQPLMEVIGKLLVPILESLGIDKNVAEMIGQIIGALAAAALMIGAVALAGSAVSKVSGELTKRFGIKIADKLMNNIVGDAIKSIGKGLGKHLGMQEAKIAQIVNRTQFGTNIASFLNSGIETSSSVISANMQLKAAHAQAALINNAALLNLLESLNSIIMQAFETQTERQNSVIKTMSSNLQSKEQAGKFISHQMSSVAG